MCIFAAHETSSDNFYPLPSPRTASRCGATIHPHLARRAILRAAICLRASHDLRHRPTDFLEKGQTYHVTIYNDDPMLSTRSKVSTTTTTIRSGKPITLHLQPSGGAALHIMPARK